jgi:ferritin-like metal-binding protein YciE
MAKQQVGGLKELLLEELRDLFDAERQLVKALPKMAKQATDVELETALRNHLEITRGQVQRLEQVFATMDTRPRSTPCRGMKGIVEEGREVMQEERDDAILDSAIAASGRKVEHYEMMGYETARSIAQQLGLRDAAQLLQQTLQEEILADRELAQISKRLLREGGGRVRAPRLARATRSTYRGSSRRSGGSASRSLTGHDEIRRWAEARSAHPACVRGTGRRGDIGMIRLDFPGYSGADSLQPISWDAWFREFDQRGLALLVQDKTATGRKSNFNKLVSRESVGRKARAAR